MGLQRSDVLALIALFISLVALAITALQLLQQYFSTAEGQRRCAESVMGIWAGGTTTKFHWRELRYEVIFETPVLFLSSPTNVFGPLGEEPKKRTLPDGRIDPLIIRRLDGTEKSYKETGLLKPEKQQELDEKERMNIHTADDERASWVTLVTSIQAEEAKSREWDKHKSMSRPRKSVGPEYTLVVGYQLKRRSWDYMPPAISRPFATTTISHLIEIASMLGMFWKTFDRKTYNLRAEGNGFAITSTQIDGWGVMALINISKKHQWGARRPVPNELARELSFGRVRHLWSTDSTPDPLLFGSSEEVKEMNQTLGRLGVTPDNIKNYANNHIHLFSIAFEIIGMLGIPYRLRGSNFRRLPNPTSDYYDQLFHKAEETPSENPDFLGLRGQDKVNGLPFLMEAFQDEVEKHYPMSDNFLVLQQWEKIKPYWNSDDRDFDIDLQEALLDAIKASNTYILRPSRKAVLRVVGHHFNTAISGLDELGSKFDSETEQSNGSSLSNERIFMNHYFKFIRETLPSDRAESHSPKATSPETNAPMATNVDIWTVLVFRMLCWLLVHDFAVDDINILPSDLNGSRMPIYIG